MAKRQPKRVSRDVVKQLNIFDHIANITANKSNWEDYSETDVKSFDSYMINRFLSMDFNLIEIVNIFQKYTIGFLGKREVFKLYSGILPSKKYFLRYIKSKGEGTYKPELIEYLKKYYEAGSEEIKDYLDIYFLNSRGKEQVEEILKKYGLEDKKIKDLMKLKK